MEQPSSSAQAQREQAIIARYPPPGRMIDIGGRRLHLLALGLLGSQRAPTVIIEGGACGASLWYRALQAEVATIAPVCVYNRAGIGWSDPAPLPRSLADRADDLYALLCAADLPPPFIFIGHSLGGLLVRLFASRYPAMVAGLILADPSNERVHGTEAKRQELMRHAAGFDVHIATLVAGGHVAALHNPFGLPEQEILQRESVLRAGQDELRALASVGEEFARPACRRMGAAGALGETPLVVISRGRARPDADAAGELAWRDAHRWLATLSARSLHLIADDCGHELGRPGLMRLAVERVLAMLDDDAVVPARGPGQPPREQHV